MHSSPPSLPPSLPSLARRYMPPELLSFGFGGAEAHPDLAFATTPTMQANSSIVGTSTAASARDIQGRAPTDSIDNMTMTDVETGVGIASQDLRGLMLSHQSGTYPARAPETPGSARYDGRAWDVYSMGASLFPLTHTRGSALTPSAPALHSTPLPSLFRSTCRHGPHLHVEATPPLPRHVGVGHSLRRRTRPSPRNPKFDAARAR